jgi:hypothetical protein
MHLAKMTICLVASLLLANFVPGCGGMGMVQEPPDPIEELQGKWAAYDFNYGSNYELKEWAWFVLRTPEYVDQYYDLLKEKEEIPEEQIRKEKAKVEDYLVIEASLEFLDRNTLEHGKWNFELKDDKDNKYTPVRIDASPVTQGKEVTTSYDALKVVTVEKKRGGVTTESITPTFYVPQEAHNWCRTYILYFPKNQPDSENPVLSKSTEELEIVARVRGLLGSTTRLKGKWKVAELPMTPE